MQLIDGKLIAATLKQEIAAQVAELTVKAPRKPMLVAVLVGHDGGSETYVASKMKSCEECGFGSQLIRFEDDVTEEMLLGTIKDLNDNDHIDGYIVQLPLPKHINTEKIISAINPLKDVDGFTPVNVGKMTLGLPGFLPATPAGIMELIKRYNIPTSSKNCVILGRSDIVGKPMAIMLMQKGYPGDCTVTVCHSKTKDIKDICRQADILIAAMGKPGYVTEDFVKEGAVVIDVGTTRVTDPSRKSGYRLSGDVDFNNVAPKCSYITPVPGGVGPMTIASLMKNTLLSYKRRFNLL